jgi:hypothetical protein
LQNKQTTKTKQNNNKKIKKTNTSTTTTKNPAFLWLIIYKKITTPSKFSLAT